MTIATDPIDYAEVDRNHTNSATLPLAVALNGYGTQFFESDEANAIFGNAAEWKAWIDQTRASAEQVYGAVSCRLSATAFEYTAVPGFTQDLDADSFLLVLGKYVSLTIARVAKVGTYDTFTFAPSQATHFHVAADGTLAHEVVGIFVPPTPPGGYVHLHTVFTDGVGVSSQAAGDAFADQRTLSANPVEFAGGVLVNTGNVQLDIVNLILNRDGGSDQDISMIVDGDTTRGWLVQHTSSDELVVFQRIAGVATEVLDFGASGTPAGWARPVTISSAEGVAGDYALEVDSTDDLGPGSHFRSKRTTALTLEATGPGGAPLVLVPRATPVGGNVVGTLLASNTADADLYYKDNNAAVRRCWATQSGQVLGSTFNSGQVNNAAAGVVVASVNVDFVATRRYVVMARCRVGRFTGSTRDAQFTTTVNAVNVPYSVETHTMFQAGGGTQLELMWSGEAVFTAGTTGTLTVQILLTPVNGAGNINYAGRGIVVLGAWD